MEKLAICIIAVFGILAVQPAAIANSNSTAGIIGPASVSPGCTITYTVYPGTSGSAGHCVREISTAYLNDSTLGFAEVIGARVQITFKNNTINHRFGVLTVNYNYWDKCNERTTDLKTAKLEMPITVKGLPALPENPIVRPSGSSYSITTNSSNAVDYRWTISGGLKSGDGSQISVAPEDCGSMITGTVQAFNSCAVYSGVRSFSFQSPSVAPSAPSIDGPTTISDGGVGIFSSTGEALPTSWQWQVNYKPGVVKFTPSNSNFIVVKHQDLDGQTHMPNIQVRVNNRCGSSPWSDTRQFAVLGTNATEPFAVVKPENLEENLIDDGADYYIISNATTSGIQLSQDVQQLMDEGFEKIDIYDLDGNSVKKVRLKRMKDNVISVEKIENGQYIFKLVGDETTYSQKVMVKQ